MHRIFINLWLSKGQKKSTSILTFKALSKWHEPDLRLISFKFLQTLITLRENNYEKNQKKNLVSAAVTAFNEHFTSCLVILIEHAHDFIYRRHPGRNKQQFFRFQNVNMHVIPCRSKSLHISRVVSHFY